MMITLKRIPGRDSDKPESETYAWYGVLTRMKVRHDSERTAKA